MNQLRNVFAFVFAVMISLNTHAAEWPSGDWSSRVAWEAKMALSKDYANAKTPIEENAAFAAMTPTTSGGYSAWYGNWDYVYDPIGAWALQQATTEAGGVTGQLGSWDGTKFRGGWCTFFVRLVLYRSSYWTGNGVHLTMMTPSVYTKDTTPGSTTTSWGSVQPGWIFIRTPEVANPVGGIEHMAIAEKRENGGWWFIDSNYLGYPTYQYMIGRHFMADSKLSSQGYFAWKPHLAKSN